MLKNWEPSDDGGREKTDDCEFCEEGSTSEEDQNGVYQVGVSCQDSVEEAVLQMPSCSW